MADGMLFLFSHKQQAARARQGATVVLTGRTTGLKYIVANWICTDARVGHMLCSKSFSQSLLSLLLLIDCSLARPYCLAFILYFT